MHLAGRLISAMNLCVLASSVTPSGAPASCDELPSYMIFALLVVWLVLQFLWKWYQSRQEVPTKTEELRLLNQINDSLASNGARFSRTLENTQKLLETTNRLLDITNSITVDIREIGINTHDMHNAMLGTSARLPNGGLKWYNDPEVVRELFESTKRVVEAQQQVLQELRVLVSETRDLRRNVTFRTPSRDDIP